MIRFARYGTDFVEVRGDAGLLLSKQFEIAVRVMVKRRSVSRR